MQVECTCFVCGKKFSRKPSQVGRFCSVPCRVKGMELTVPPLEISADGTTAFVPLYGRGGIVKAVAAIDAADAAWVGRWRWSLSAKGYASRGVQIGKKNITIRLNRMLLGLVPGDNLDGDHVDRDRLNNRRSNLRIVPKGRNAQNKSSYTGTSSKYRGVSWKKSNQKWQAEIKTGNTRKYLGLFDSEEAAAEAAKAARAEHMPYAID